MQTHRIVLSQPNGALQETCLAQTTFARRMPARLKAAVVKPLLAATDLIRMLRLREVPVGARVQMCMLALRAWSRMPSSNFELTFPTRGNVFFAGESLNSDWNTFSEIFLSRCYSTDFEDAVVIDVGAHKGYFGAFASLRNAFQVRSFEPESSNYSLLQRTAKSFRLEGQRWSTSKLAVGHEESLVDLHVSGESWTHSLLPLPQQGRRKQMGVERVQMIPLNTVIEQAAELDRRVILKIDVEGTECQTVFATDSGSWGLVHEVFIETHPFASCSQTAITKHLEQAGLHRHEDSTSQIAHLKREGI